MNRDELIEHQREELKQVKSFAAGHVLTNERISKKLHEVEDELSVIKEILKNVLSTHDYHADDGAEAAERAYEVLYPDKES